MKRYLALLLAYAVVLTGAMFLLGGCATAPHAFEPLVRAIELAAADGAISPAELQAILALLPSPPFDWMEALKIAGGIAGSILGVKLLPNSLLRGPFDQPKPQPPV